MNAPRSCCSERRRGAGLGRRTGASGRRAVSHTARKVQAGESRIGADASEDVPWPARARRSPPRRLQFAQLQCSNLQRSSAGSESANSGKCRSAYERCRAPPFALQYVRAASDKLQCNHRQAPNASALTLAWSTLPRRIFPAAAAIAATSAGCLEASTFKGIGCSVKRASSLCFGKARGHPPDGVRGA